MPEKKTLLLSREGEEELEHLTATLLPDTFERVVESSEGIQPLLSTLHTRDADWTILLDPGAPVRIEGLKNFMEEKGYVCCAMPDGGVVKARAGNPLVGNPFFLMLNTKVLRQCFKKKPIGEATLKADPQSILPKHLMRYPYSLGARADYDAFFFALHNKTLPVLWLDAVQWVRDMGTTVLADHQRRTVLMHTWATENFHQQKPRFEQAQKFSLLVQEQLQQ